MANSPPTYHVVKHKGTGNVQVYPLLPTQVLGTQDGSNVGTGGPVAPLLETPPAGSFATNRNIEFLDDRFVLHLDNFSVNSWGTYKKSQGGAGLWGRVASGGVVGVDGSGSGLYVLHPNGVPTLAFLMFDSSDELLIFSTADGTTGGSWGSAGTIIETNAAQPSTHGQSIVYRDSIFWAHRSFVGGAGTGAITQYDLKLATLTRYDVSLLLSGLGCSFAWHVHDNALFLASWDATARARITKLQAGAFINVVQDGVQAAAGGSNPFGSDGNNAMFSDPTTGDLIAIWSGQNWNNDTPRTRIVRVQNPTTSPVLLDISSTVMGTTEGADKYLEGGGSTSQDRRWAINVDTTTDPLAPRTFLTTWLPGASTETWEWKGVGAEIEAVALLAGISDDFVLPYNTVGGGHRSPRTAAVEIGDVSNPHEEAVGGTKFFFRGRGNVAVGVVTFRGTDSEGSPSTVIPIVIGSIVVESGSPPTTPTISTNTLINFTPDNGATLYSIILDVDAVGVDIVEGDIGLIIPEFV